MGSALTDETVVVVADELKKAVSQADMERA
jgi:hypothetical protein